MLYSLAVVAVVVAGTQAAAAKPACSEQQLINAEIEFKDCLSRAKSELLHSDSNSQEYYCSGLENLSAGCEAAVVRLAACKDRPHVEDLVAIHTHGLAGILSQLHPSVDLASCPVFLTEAPPSPAAEPGPEYKPVTGGGAGLAASLAMLVLARLF